MENKAELHRLFREQALDRHDGHWLARLEEQDLLCAPVQTLGEALASEQTAANNMIVSLDANGSGRNEPLKLVASPITMDASAFRLRHAPPSLGEHGDGDPGRTGLRADRIAELRKGKVLS